MTSFGQLSYRHEFAKLVAVLSREMGPQHLDLIEDAVQTALLKSLEAWQSKTLPENPAG